MFIAAEINRSTQVCQERNVAAQAGARRRSGHISLLAELGKRLRPRVYKCFVLNRNGSAQLLVLCMGLTAFPATVLAKGDDFGAVVKTIERFYHVKHKGIPFLARAGMKATTTVARIKGGEAKKLAEAGSVKIAFFEDQEFNSHGELVSFRNSMKSALGDWSPLIQTTAPKAEEQTYIFLKDAGEKFNVLVVTIEKHDATVVQVTLAPKTLALLMQDPAGMGKAITDDAKDDQE